MKEWVSVVASAGAGIVASLFANALSSRLKRHKTEEYEVRLGSGDKQSVKISGTNNPNASALDALFGAIEILGSNLTPESLGRLEQATRELEAEKSDAVSRHRALVLGRAYWAIGNPERAKEVLYRFIEVKLRAGQYDRDLGDAYYNLACYLALGGQKELAVENLKLALTYNPSDSELAAVDPDLSTLHEYLPAILEKRSTGPS